MRFSNVCPCCENPLWEDLARLRVSHAELVKALGQLFREAAEGDALTESTANLVMVAIRESSIKQAAAVLEHAKEVGDG